jgi:hypothetical protein
MVAADKAVELPKLGTSLFRKFLMLRHQRLGPLAGIAEFSARLRIKSDLL